MPAAGDTTSGDLTAGDLTRDRSEDVFVVERPWGSFQQLTSGEPVTVKTISVEPGHRLSLQTHGHRAEMWYVLDGELDIVVDDRAWTARRDDFVWVPQGAEHRMGNSSAEPARILEIAFGDFDEADIVRLQDDYTR